MAITDLQTRNTTDPYVEPATRTSTPYTEAQATAPTTSVATGITPDTGTMTNAGPSGADAILRPGDMTGTTSGGLIGGAQTAGGTTSTASGTTPEDLSSFAPTGSPGSSINPITREITEPETVQGQLNTILKTGNPLLEAAKARAAQQANSRGLQNSSMAVQAGEEAMVNTALPIASQDAATYNRQAQINQDISNQFLSMDKGAKLDLEAAYEAFKKNNYMFDKDEKLKRYINDTGNDTQMKVAAMQAAAQTSSASISAGASNYATDARLKEAGMQLDAAKAAQTAGFDHDVLMSDKAYSQQNFNSYISAMNGINASEMPLDQKTNWARSLTTYYSGAAMPPNITFNLDALPGG